MSILNQLWNGTFNPECPALPPETEERQRVHSTRAEEFMRTLTKEQRKMVFSLEVEENALRELQFEALFLNSFRQGALLMLDILRN